MPAAGFAVGLGIGDLVDQQQLAHQQQSDAGAHQRGGIQPGAQGNQRTQHHHRAKADTGGQQAQPGGAGNPAGVGEYQHYAGGTQDKHRQAAQPQKIQANGNHQGQGAKSSKEHPFGRRGSFRQGSAAAGKRRAAGGQVEARDKVFVLVQQVNDNMGQNRADEHQQGIQQGGWFTLLPGHGQPERDTQWCQNQEIGAGGANNRYCFRHGIPYLVSRNRGLKPVYTQPAANTRPSTTGITTRLPRLLNNTSDATLWGSCWYCSATM